MTIYAHNKSEVEGKCVAVVYNDHCSIGHQCIRDRGHGEYYMFCLQHAKMDQFVRV